MSLEFHLADGFADLVQCGHGNLSFDHFNELRNLARQFLVAQPVQCFHLEFYVGVVGWSVGGSILRLDSHIFIFFRRIYRVCDLDTHFHESQFGLNLHGIRDIALGHHSLECACHCAINRHILLRNIVRVSAPCIVSCSFIVEFEGLQSQLNVCAILFESVCQAFLPH